MVDSYGIISFSIEVVVLIGFISRRFGKVFSRNGFYGMLKFVVFLLVLIFSRWFYLLRVWMLVCFYYFG